jgi:formylglycine-generating enzyme required for sulfatase activity
MDNAKIPFEAYKGTDPYIFISYAHKDSDKVFPIISEFHKAGFHVWYDEGIDPGNEWTEDIAKAVQKCSLFIVFISTSAVESFNVRREINYALTQDRSFIHISLEDASAILTQKYPGLDMQISSTQGIMRYRMEPENFFRKCLQSFENLGIKRVKIQEKAETVGTAAVKAQAPANLPEITAPEKQKSAEAAVKAQAPANLPGITAAFFVFIQGGTFTMGSPASEAGRSSHEGPQHQVTVSSFYMGKYEVTQKEYQAIMENNPSHFKGDNLPVEQVSWFDAVNYCNKRSVKEGLNPAYTVNGENVTWNKNANGYRLPTEAEWEYACRAGTISPFNTGNNITTNQANYNGDKPYNNNAKGIYREKTTEVGSFTPNAWGLYDMHGNVWEWCWDWYGEYSKTAQTDPSGASPGAYRVIRGGSYNFDAQFLRSAFRLITPPTEYYHDDHGFRLVRP